MPKKKELGEVMGHDHYAELTGLKVVRAESGYAEVSMAVTPKLLNGHGNVHGGALYTLADYAGAVASNLLGEATMATGCSISYLRSVQSGTVVAKAKTVKSGRRMKFQVVEIFNEAGEMVAMFQGSAITVARRQVPAT